MLFNFASCSAVARAGSLSGDAAVLMTWQVMAFHSALLFVLVGATQPISGGHFNPMVSTMMAFWGELPWKRLPLYISAQLVGAAIGSGAQFYSLPAGLQDVAHASVQVLPPSMYIYVEATYVYELTQAKPKCCMSMDTLILSRFSYNRAGVSSPRPSTAQM